MATAKVERALARVGKGPLGKAADDEPVFVLRGQDKIAWIMVDLWSALAEADGCSPAKVAEARALSAAMRAWPNQKSPD